MQHYFIHINEGAEVIVDKEGLDFVDANEAAQEARVSIIDMAADAIRRGLPFNLVSLQICDSVGTVVREVFARNVFLDLLGQASEQPLDRS